MELPTAISTVLIACVAALTWGCERDGQSRDPGQDASTSSFIVDGEGVDYLYYDPARGLHRAETLSDIPLEYRVAVVVTTSSESVPSFDANSFPVAELLESGPGDRASRTEISKKRLVHQNLASSYGHQQAIRIRFWAEEVAQLSPNSERSRAADRALRLLEERTKPAIRQQQERR